MARTTFIDGSTVIASNWANKVDATVVDGLGEADTPAGVRQVIGAASAEDLVIHTGNTSDPHNVRGFLLGGYLLRVVTAIPATPDPSTIYFKV